MKVVWWWWWWECYRYCCGNGGRFWGNGEWGDWIGGVGSDERRDGVIYGYGDGEFRGGGVLSVLWLDWRCVLYGLIRWDLLICGLGYCGCVWIDWNCVSNGWVLRRR